LSAVAVGKVFVLELQRLGNDETLDGAGFEVRPPRFRATDESRLSFGEQRPGEGRAATVFAVMPVFDRLDFTRACIGRLKSQSYAPIRIVVADGGSTDGTVEAIRSEHGDVVVLAGCRAVSWSGLMEMGIGHALRQSDGEGDCVLMMNNDTVIPDDYVETLVRAARQHDAAVGPLIVDSRDPARILNAGVSIDWTHYEVCVKSAIGPGERFWGGVDVLPGQGSLGPLRMIRSVGNIDSKALPHHLADYEFSGRLKLRGFRLGVCYETALLAPPEESGIASSPGPRTVASILRQAFDRRWRGNIVDHWRFVGRCAPASARLAVRVKLVRNLIADLVLRSSLRPLFHPLLRLWRLPRKAAGVIARQLRVHRRFAVAVAGRGVDVLCQPECFPRWAASTLYYLASPGPIRGDDCARIGLDAPSLVDRGFLRELGDGGWYALATLRFGRATDRNRLRRLFWMAWVPWRKRANARTLRRDLGAAR
jgi:glycosyltransferase involved in cell wall biosynthesis